MSVDVSKIQLGDKVKISLYGLPESDWLEVKGFGTEDSEWGFGTEDDEVALLMPDGDLPLFPLEWITAHEPAAPDGGRPVNADHTPTTEEVRRDWVWSHRTRTDLGIDRAELAFDRWLRAVEAAAKAEAWDRGYWARQVDLGAADTTPNPYRKGADQ